MKPTDISTPDYFHKVVDCQWACPAHTPVPEYIRLIAAGRYSDAYMVNWKSNVFPGILGRTCDRLVLHTHAPARWFARPVAGTAEDSGKHVGFPVDHVGVAVAARCDQPDVFRNRSMSRTGPLAIHDLVEVVRRRNVGRFH